MRPRRWALRMTAVLLVLVGALASSVRMPILAHSAAATTAHFVVAAEDDVALGLSHSPAGNGPLLRPFADGLGAKTWTDPAFDDLVSLRQQGATWESISEKIIDRTVSNGGKLHFNLAELDPKRVGITTHELRYACASPALRAATTFYGGGSPC